MNLILLLAAVVTFACVLMNRLTNRLGLPVLLAFIGLGMLFGSDGILKIPFEDFEMAEKICSVALIFIMFYGGFGTNLREARPVLGRALLLSSAGVVVTAALTGLFCHFVLGFGLLEGLLLGAVLGSTDAASVFSILRSKKLGLRYHTASLLEVESGSNDPFAYMLTVILLSVMGGEQMGVLEVLRAVGAQLVFGAGFGLLIAWGAIRFLRRFTFPNSGMETVFVLGVALFSFALPTLVGGNGYLSAYVVGILLGNAKLKNKNELVHFFDGVTGFAQMALFFLLGLLAFPSQMGINLLPALAIALFLTLVARPVAVCSLLAPFRAKLGQLVVVSWAGLRGAASIVFAILVRMSPVAVGSDVFHIAFCVVLFSIAIQGSLLPLCARRTGMIDETESVLKTFSDYSDEEGVQFIRIELREENPWVGKKIRELTLPPRMLVAVIYRGEGTVIPGGDTEFLPGDIAVLSAVSKPSLGDARFEEVEVEKKSSLCGRRLREIELPAGELVVLIRRGEEMLVPKGDTVILEGDLLVLNERN